MKKIPYLTVLLVLIVVLAGGALAFANNVTVPAIVANELAVEKETLKEIYPDVGGDAFVKVKDDALKIIEKISEMGGKGHISKMKVTGYRDDTSYLVALNGDGSVYDHVVIPNGDTQGLSSKVAEKPFRESLKEKDAVGEKTLDDTITGVTVSSKSVIEGIRETAKYQVENLK